MARTTGSDDLYRLIHSLTTEEKGYFKKFSKRHASKGTSYLKLFDAINKQTAFEEASLKKKFKDFAVMKVYLKNMLLQTLLLSELNNDARQVVDRNISFARIYASKGMRDAALKLLHQTVELADKNDFFNQKITLLGAMDELLIREVAPAIKWDFIAEKFKDEVRCREQRDYISRLLFEQRKVFFLIEERSSAKPYKHRLNDIDATFLKKEMSPISNRARIIRNNTLGAYYDLTSQPVKQNYMKLIKPLTISVGMQTP
jgi:hypothetical protein